MGVTDKATSAARGTIVLAAGGTGGHLFPAQALAEELARRGFVVDLMTDMRGDRYGTGFPARTIHRIPAATFSGSNPLVAAKALMTLTNGVRIARRILSNLRPVAVIGFGGYPSFPPIVAASLLSIPTILHEQNAVLGRANRFLARRVTAIATSFESVRLLEGAARTKAHFTGNPVRDSVIAWAHAPYDPSAPDDPFRLLVFGGSQGARFFSQTVPPALAMLPLDLRRRLSVVQQARPEDKDEVAALYAGSDVAIEAMVETFFTNLPEVIAASHLVIARAGASSVAELAAIGRPSILVPLPHALDNDQLANATRLQEAGGALCLEQKNITPQSLANHLARMMRAPDELATMAAAAKKEGRPDAVSRLADLVATVAGKMSAAA
ncbi:MAG: undecaprenyldiphospho-muramoylpentapeptide beta-N-acetylglucosaminyltransferase [Hyphomicrobiaceae bacterium]